ncbi:MAG: hypothetical protein OCU22_03755 [Canidatus Methanoxibalbensis ujae]|nr:hypothetical protein [Candidatus Methanoxibalbensis ujae]
MEVMQMRVWFMKTSDPSRIVAIVPPPSDQYLYEYDPQPKYLLLKGRVHPFTRVTNVLKRSTMDDIRRFVKAHSLRLREPEALYTAAYQYPSDELTVEEEEEWEEYKKLLSLARGEIEQ